MDDISLELLNEQPIDMQIESDDETSMSAAESVVVRTERDYNRLNNKPRINSVTIAGDLTLPELGLRNIYYDTSANWNSQPQLVSQEGCLYIYSDYKTETDDYGNQYFIPGIRIGDGQAFLIDLPFVSSAMTEALYEHINNTQIHVTAAEKEFWNNKVSSYMDGDKAETLVLSKQNYVIEGDIYNG